MIERLGTAKRLWEVLLWLVEVGIAVVAFVNSVGGPIQFLIGVAFFGFACYAALFVVVPAAMFALQGLESTFGRSTTDIATAVTAAASALGGGALIRLGLFAPNVSHDLDAIGTGFAVIVGIAIVAMPLVALWYLHGSEVRG